LSRRLESPRRPLRWDRGSTPQKEGMMAKKTKTKKCKMEFEFEIKMLKQQLSQARLKAEEAKMHLRHACVKISCLISKPTMQCTAIEVAEEEGWNCFEEKVVNITDSEGNSIEIKYDDDGRMKTVRQDGVTGTVSYDSRGNVVRVQYDDGVYESWVFDEYDRAVSSYVGLDKE
jgi:uncharacterized protein RhaS with RHS repeats